MREQQSAAVWPKLIISNAFVTFLGDCSFYRLQVKNVGIGPAIIRNVEIDALGQRFMSMDDYAHAVLLQHQAVDSLYYEQSDLLPDDVIPQSEMRELFNTRRTRMAVYFVPKRTKFKMTIAYESVCGKKWQVTHPHTHVVHAESSTNQRR